MKRELQVGDRVAVYDRNVRFTAVVVGFHDGNPDHVNVRADGRSMPTSPYCQRKQLRRLIRRKRRRWVLKYGPVGWFVMEPHVPVADPEGEQVEVIEARPRKAGRG